MLLLLLLLLLQMVLLLPLLHQQARISMSKTTISTSRLQLAEQILDFCAAPAAAVAAVVDFGVAVVAAVLADAAGLASAPAANRNTPTDQAATLQCSTSAAPAPPPHPSGSSANSSIGGSIRLTHALWVISYVACVVCCV